MNDVENITAKAMSRDRPNWWGKWAVCGEGTGMMWVRIVYGGGGGVSFMPLEKKTGKECIQKRTREGRQASRGAETGFVAKKKN